MSAQPGAASATIPAVIRTMNKMAEMIAIDGR
jgi:hypothetical protein